MAHDYSGAGSPGAEARGEPRSPARLARELRALAGEIERTPNEGEAHRLAREIRVVADELADAWREDL